jgi:hypothetical protein
LLSDLWDTEHKAAGTNRTETGARRVMWKYSLGRTHIAKTVSWDDRYFRANQSEEWIGLLGLCRATSREVTFMELVYPHIVCMFAFLRESSQLVYQMIRPVYCLVGACANVKGQCRTSEPNHDGNMNFNIRRQQRSEFAERYALGVWVCVCVL